MARATRRQGGGQQRQRRSSRVRPAQLEQLNLNAAGIDVGATEHWVAVPADRDAQPVQRFGAFTADLYTLAAWLRQCQIDTVVMESTGVYWIALFEVLEERGFDVKLVDPHSVRQVPGRKTDAKDCQWLQELHTYGFLRGAFRPEDEVCVLRSYLRQRRMLVAMAARSVQHMQKALEHMNLKLTEVVSDITGKTGMTIIRAILEGERDSQVLATHEISAANTIRPRSPRPWKVTGARSISLRCSRRWSSMSFCSSNCERVISRLKRVSRRLSRLRSWSRLSRRLPGNGAHASVTLQPLRSTRISSR